MSDLLRHPLTGEWVFYAPERGGRPGALDSRRPRLRTSPQDCPFCPGNEDETPPEIDRTDDGGHWQIRAVPNRFPAVTGSGGSHEVIIESPGHDDRFHKLSPAHAVAVIDVYRRRFSALTRSTGTRYITVFKNDGPDSGQSIDHLHSQIVAIPVMPPRAELIERGFARGHCPVCHAMNRNHRLAETDGVVAVSPSVPLYPYELWLVPRRHAPTFMPLTPPELIDLAHLMQNATRAYDTMFDGVSFNWIFHNAGIPERPEFHWFVQMFPRLALQGGFELGSGMQINIVRTEHAVEELREAMK